VTPPLRLAATILIAAGVAFALTAPASAATASLHPTPSTRASVPTAAVAAPKVSVGLTLADSGDLGAGEPLQAVVTVVNPTTTETPAATATLSIDANPFTSRSTLAAWFSGKTSNSIAATDVATAAVPAVSSQLTGSADLTAAATALPLTFPGVYGVSVEVKSGSTVIGSARTAVAWNAASAATVPVAIAVPLTVPASSSGFLTAAQLTQYTAPGGILTTELSDVQGTDITIGIDPRVIASIRVLGKSAPASAVAWLKALGQLPNESFPLAWADADLTAPLHAGSGAVLATKSLDYAINPALFPTSSGTTPTPAPGGSTGSTSVPTSSSLVAWDYTLPSLEWPATSSVEPTDLKPLAAAGISSLIVSSGNVDDPDGQGLDGASAKSDSTTLAVSDDVLSGYLRTAAATTTRTSAVTPITELTTTLALMGLQSTTPRAVLLTLGSNWATSTTSFTRTLGDLYARSWVSGATMTGVLAESRQSVTLDKDTEADSRIDAVGELLSAESEVAQFAPIAKNPTAITSANRLELLALLSNEWIDTPTTWATAVQAYLSQADDAVSSVQVAHSSRILAGSDQISLPISITNGLDQDVTVQLSVRPRTARLSIDPADQVQTLVIPADSQRRVQIPIDAVSNGKAQLVVRLTSASGLAVGSPQVLQIDVQAGWETIGTLIFVALVVALFAFGLIRNIRKRRRANAAADDDAGVETDGAGTND